MAHLGADVAAYVDGQLSESAMRDASTHLERCDDCEKAVRQQRLLKSRMSTVAAPSPPAALVASLADLASTPPRRESRWARWCRSVPLRAGVVVAGASVAVVAAAYAVGGAEQHVGDDVTPPFDRYAADFSNPPIVQAATVIPETTMDELDSSGWPCHETLAGDLQRVSGTYTDSEEVVALSYTDGTSRLHLFEQTGALDREGLEGFTRSRLGRSQVWVRHGDPTLVSWDDDGTVFTIVTDVDHERVAQAVDDLPRARQEPGPVDRVGDGLSRMSSWLGAA